VWLARAIGLTLCILAANALVGERGLSQTLRTRREFQRFVAELSRLQSENARLSQRIEQLRHDARTIESVAREELGLIKPGEILVVVPH
jgi:cell division protein FtsB